MSCNLSHLGLVSRDQSNTLLVNVLSFVTAQRIQKEKPYVRYKKRLAGKSDSLCPLGIVWSCLAIALYCRCPALPPLCANRNLLRMDVCCAHFCRLHGCGLLGCHVACLYRWARQS